MVLFLLCCRGMGTFVMVSSRMSFYCCSMSIGVPKWEYVFVLGFFGRGLELLLPYELKHSPRLLWLANEQAQVVASRELANSLRGGAPESRPSL